MVKRILVNASITTGVAILAVIAVAGAQTTTTSSTASVSEPQVLQVSTAGKVLMRGTIASVASGVLTVTSWGGNWTVNVPSSARVLPVAVGNDITQFKRDDFVGVQGSISTSANWTVNATLVRDWTYRTAVMTQEKQNIHAAQSIRQSGPRDYIGTASNVNGSTFTLNGARNTSYAVNVSPSTEVVNRNWVTIPLTNIQTDNNVRVYGVNTSGTIAAQIVRDVSIPVTSTTAH